MTRNQFDAALHVLRLCQMDADLLPRAEAARWEEMLYLCRQLDAVFRTGDDLLMTKVAEHPRANDLLDYLATFAGDDRAKPLPEPVTSHEPGSLEEMQDAARSMIEEAAKCADLVRAKAALDFANDHGSPFEVERAQRLVNKLTPLPRRRR